MIKVTFLLVRNPAFPEAEFVAYHNGPHASLFMSLPVVKETVRAYVQQHALKLALPGLPPTKYDGITELWFDDVESFGRCFSEKEYMEKVRPDEMKLFDLPACDLILSTENRVK